MVAEVSTPEPEDPQRQRILDAALEVLRSKGSAAFTVRNVATAAGCSTTGVYTWFGGKPGLVEAIFVNGFRSFGAALAAVYDDPDPKAPGRAYRSWALANPTQYLVMFGGAVPGWEPSEEAMVVAGEAFERLVTSTEEANPDDARAEAMYLWATMHGYVMLELVGMTGPDLADAESLFDYGLTRIAVSWTSNPER